MSLSTSHSPHQTDCEKTEISSIVWPNVASVPLTNGQQFGDQDHLSCIYKEDHNHNAEGACIPPSLTLYTDRQKDYTGSSASSQVHLCRWAECGMQCISVADLVDHVNNVHFAACASNSVDEIHSSSKISKEAQFMTTTWSHDHAFKCLWDSCQSKEIGQHTAWNDDGNVILQHILQAHVGINHYDSLASSTGTSKKRKSQSILSTEDERESEITWTSSMLAADCGCENSEKGQHPCNWKDCSLTFANHEELTNHITEEHIGWGKAEYTCQWKGCSRGNRTFHQKQKIVRHLQTHTGHRPFACDICQKRFSEANTLAQHKRVHTREKPYKCDYPDCNKYFAVVGSLTIHKRIHTGEKPFKCTWKGCHQAFAESSNLSKHMRIHTGERPFICTELGCHKSFSRPDQLTRHRKTHMRESRTE